MFRFVRQPSRQLRLWILAAVGVLLLTSVIEAGHVHGVFTEANDHCVLCEHSVGHAHATGANLELALLPLVSLLVVFFLPGAVSRLTASFAHIRAPPTQLR